MSSRKPYVLCVLDGFGYSEKQEGNAIAQAQTPFWDYLWKTYPHSLLEASGEYVGLPHGQMGNSEVGHLNIGAGRTVLQTLPRIQNAIKDGSYKHNSSLVSTIQKLKENKKSVHFVGLLSDGGVHSHQAHALAYAQYFIEEGIPVFLHAITDGRDTAPCSSPACFQYVMEQAPQIKIATICGRYYGMDRDNNMDRTVLCYDAITKGTKSVGDHDGRISRANSWEGVLSSSHEDGITDEFILPYVIDGYAGIEEGDALFMFNFRADRMRQLTRSFITGDVAGFNVEKVMYSSLLNMAEYDASFSDDVSVLYPPEAIVNGLGEFLSSKGLPQLRLAETEKYAHVTFFFNGGVEKPFPGEERHLIPSAKVKTYDLKPEMSAPEITKALVGAIESKKYDVIVVNYANADMVGHTGNMSAAIQAVEVLDRSLSDVYKAVCQAEGFLLITADHGNADVMQHEGGGRVTSHSLSPVPFVVCGQGAVSLTLKDGRLSDVAPSLLHLMGLDKPEEMTGETLLA